jgi:predicted AAA+ superfamily ATPase
MFFMQLLPKFSHSVDRSVAGGKKVYFSDTGILNQIAKVTSGQLLETAVANQLNYYGYLSFFNKRNTAEIDFILDKSIAFEVKRKAVDADMRKLKKLSDSLNLQKAYVLSLEYVELDGVGYPYFL